MTITIPRALLIACLFATFGIAQAQNKVVVIPLGLDTPTGNTELARTLIVSPVSSDPIANGAALVAAVNSVQTLSPPPTESDPYLIKIEPGVYDIQTSAILMTSFVDIEGSGIFTTHIIGQGSNQYSVIKLQDDSELRLMTVKNTFPEPAFPVRAITVAGTTGQ